MLQPDNTIKRIHRKQILGTFEEYPSKRLALRLLDRRLAKLNSFTYKPTVIATFKDLSERWEATILPMHKPSSQNSEIGHINKWLLPFFGNLPLSHITTETVQQFVSGIQSDVSPKTIRNVVGTFRNMLNTAKSWGYLTLNPALDVRFPALSPKIPETFSAEQVQKILTAAQEPLKSLLWVAAETGIRGGELCGLRVADLDLENCIIQVRQSAWRGHLQTPKTANAIRRFALSPQLCSHLKWFLETQWKDNPENILFPSKAGTPQDNHNVVQLQLKPLLEKLNLKKLGLHAFRHTSASIMDQLNVPLKTRTNRLGHSDPLLTLRTYTHAIPEEDRKVASAIGDLLSPNHTHSFSAFTTTTAHKTIWLKLK